MSDTYFMGIDGGGSNLRIVITDEFLNPITQYKSTTASPSVIGHDVAQQHIRDGIHNTLEQAQLSVNDISAVGVGIAGASNLHSLEWLLDTMSPALPHTIIVPSSDLEIALVGALGQREGILVLSGTGSAIFGRSPKGEVLQLGGWGYLLDDAGSGYRIGLHALKRIIKDYEEHYAEFVAYQPSTLNQKILDMLNLKTPKDMIRWLYREAESPVTQVAQLARLVIDEAQQGNLDAINLLQTTAIYLADKVTLMKRRLNYPDAPIAFAGGLLDNDNRLSQNLADRLNLPSRPIAKYTPVIGGALLAQLEWKHQTHS